jgi:predicted DNA-binding protein
MRNYTKDKTEVLNIRISPAKKDRLTDLAKRIKTTKSDIIIQHIDYLLALYQ